MIATMTNLPEIRPSKGGVLGMTFSLFVKNAAVLLLITAITIVPVELIVCYGFSNLSIDSILKDIVISQLFLTLLTPVAVHYLVERLRGGKGSVADAYRWGLRKWLRMIMYNFLQGVIFTAGLLLFVIPGLFMYVRLLLLPAVVSIENTSVTNPLESSRNMAAGQFWRFIGLGVVVNLFSFLIGLGASKLLLESGMINGITVTLYYLFIDWVSLISVILSLVLYLTIRTEQFGASARAAEEAAVTA
ncbi:hypothetical protein EV294_11437 [Paenibacillus sp. BK033]|uniref:hypothetical protein n=1 Tax=Paenibacillus sp. BK033 TaxID=2512133 RepID=UPI00104B50E6|nr:hypothetical protein [Paenibacillus sp. BK033]TCM88640.1 hypothetical protein EV294_11437 [Paenibacillus sp. BK033]